MKLIVLLASFSYGQLVGFGLISTAFILGILHLIINHATRADKLLEEEKKQTALLAKIAKQNGINSNEIEQIMGADKF